MDEDIVRLRCRLWEKPRYEQLKFTPKCITRFNCKKIIGLLEFTTNNINCENGIIYIDWVRYILINKNFVEKI